jgi:hypothetical protein
MHDTTCEWHPEFEIKVRNKRLRGSFCPWYVVSIESLFHSLSLFACFNPLFHPPFLYGADVQWMSSCRSDDIHRHRRLVCAKLGLRLLVSSILDPSGPLTQPSIVVSVPAEWILFALREEWLSRGAVVMWLLLPETRCFVRDRFSDLLKIRRRAVILGWVATPLPLASCNPTTCTKYPGWLGLLRTHHRNIRLVHP